MKILWVVEPIIPQIAAITGETASAAGGWLVNVCDGLLENEDNSLIICYRTTGTPARAASGRLTVWSFLLDPLRYAPELECSFQELLRQEQPDVIHIWGSEFPSTLAMLNAAEAEQMRSRTVVSLQGLISICAGYYTAALPERVIQQSTFRDFVRRDNIRRQQQKFVLRGEFETDALQKAQHVIGRTGWDRASVQSIHPDAAYHDCAETLRSEFYADAWSLDSCEAHRIFVSQGNYPIKGLHQALEALAILKREFPDVKLYTTGADPREPSLQARLRRSTYARYLAHRIRALKLDRHIAFLGTLTAEQMKQQCLCARVALNPSAIENSSNAIGEAMLLGTPVVASRVGGTPDIVSDRVEGLLYPFESPQLLAEAITAVFTDDALANRLSAAARKTALERHNPEKNLTRLNEIYRLLAQSKDI